MTNDKLKLNDLNPKFDLFERTALFSENVIDLLKTVKDGSINTPIKSQLIRSSTSVGANYMEADVASSKKDFINKLSICRKESKETTYWLRLLAHANPDFKNELRILYKEAKELLLIFSKIISNTKKNLS